MGSTFAPVNNYLVRVHRQARIRRRKQCFHLHEILLMRTKQAHIRTLSQYIFQHFPGRHSILVGETNMSNFALVCQVAAKKRHCRKRLSRISADSESRSRNFRYCLTGNGTGTTHHKRRTISVERGVPKWFLGFHLCTNGKDLCGHRITTVGEDWRTISVF